MKKRQTLWGSLLLALLGGAVLLGPAACGGSLAPETEGLAGAQVLGHLQSRDAKITLYSTAAGTRFTVRDRGGRTLGENLSVEELRASQPGLFDLYQTSYARQALDATLTLPAAAPAR